MHFLFPTLFVFSPLVGLFFGWPWASVVVGVLVIPGLEWIWGRETLARGPQAAQNPPASAPVFRWGADFPRGLAVLVLIQPIALALFAGSRDWTELAWLAASVGYVSGGISIVLAHELGHRRPLIDRFMARGLLVSVAYGHYAIEHNRGHHRRAATLSDPATAREHENIFQFLPRYYFGVFRGAVGLSQAANARFNEAWALAACSALLYAASCRHGF